MEDLAEIRAALIQLSKALETEGACIKRVIHVIERRLNIEHFEEGAKCTIVPNASVASAASYRVE